MADGFFRLMKPYAARRSSAASSGMTQYQAGKGSYQTYRRINQWSLNLFTGQIVWYAAKTIKGDERDPLFPGFISAFLKME